DATPFVKNIFLLDSEGKRVAVKYFSDDWPINSAKLAFVKLVFTKTQKTKARTEAEITMFENNIVVYRFIQDLHFFVTGGDVENELALATVLQGFYDVVTLLFRVPHAFTTKKETEQGHSAPHDGRASISSNSDSNDYDPITKSLSSHHNFTSCGCFVSKPVYPLALPVKTPKFHDLEDVKSQWKSLHELSSLAYYTMAEKGQFGSGCEQMLVAAMRMTHCQIALEASIAGTQQRIVELEENLWEHNIQVAAFHIVHLSTV
ncbi:coatomer subunit zeta-1-like protein, partial [Tanacetum coccineum]